MDPQDFSPERTSPNVPPPPPPQSPLPPQFENAPQQSPAYQPSINTNKDELTYVTILHISPLILALLGMVAGMSFFGFLGPLVMWLIKKNDSSFIDTHGKEATNFNLTLGIAYLALFILTLISFGLLIFITLPIMLILFVVNLVCSIKAAIAANKGEDYRYPMTIRML